MCPTVATAAGRREEPDSGMRINRWMTRVVLGHGLEAPSNLRDPLLHITDFLDEERSTCFQSCGDGRLIIGERAAILGQHVARLAGA